MDYVILGALLLGMLLFALGWAMVVVAGFQRHPLTGLIALVPGVNLLTLPSLWHRVVVWVISGLVGVLLAAGAWFAGASALLARYLPAHPAAVAAQPNVASDNRPVTLTPPPSRAATTPQSVAADVIPPVVNESTAATPAPALEPAVVRITQDLPKAALYRVTFSELAVDKLPEQVGQYVRITQTDGRSREGKLLSSAGGRLELEERHGNSSMTCTLQVSDIRSAARLITQGGD